MNILNTYRVTARDLGSYDRLRTSNAAIDLFGCGTGKRTALSRFGLVFI